MDHYKAICQVLDVMCNPFFEGTRDEWDDCITALNELRQMFEPYSGDQLVGPKRVPHPCRCQNCGLSFMRFWLPAEASRVSLMALRGAFCPRCYATEGIAVHWDSENNDAPMSFTANVKSLDTDGLDKAARRTAKITLVLEATGTKGNIQAAEDAISGGELVTVTSMPNSKRP